MTQKRFAIVLTLCVLLTPALLAGCRSGKKNEIVVYRYPEGFHPDLKTVAVLPFANRTDEAFAGQRVSDKVSAELTRNKTYQVFNRSNLKEILNERDLAEAGIIDSETAMEIGRLKSVQALVCGICNRYDVSSEKHKEIKQVPKVRKLRNGETRVDMVNVPIMVERNEVTVECQVAVIDAVTGHQIAAFSEPSFFWSEGKGEPAEYSTDQLATIAEKDQVARILRSIAIVPVAIELRGKPIRTATSGIGAEYDWEDKFPIDQETILAVVELPRDADRNPFRIVLTPEKTKQVLYEDEFVWDGRMERMDRTIPIAPIIEEHGAGKYKVYLYSGDQAAAWYKFEIEKPDKDDD